MLVSGFVNGSRERIAGRNNPNVVRCFRLRPAIDVNQAFQMRRLSSRTLDPGPSPDLIQTATQIVLSNVGIVATLRGASLASVDVEMFVRQVAKLAAVRVQSIETETAHRSASKTEEAGGGPVAFRGHVFQTPTESATPGFARRAARPLTTAITSFAIAVSARAHHSQQEPVILIEVAYTDLGSPSVVRLI